MSDSIGRSGPRGCCAESILKPEAWAQEKLKLADEEMIFNGAAESSLN